MFVLCAVLCYTSNQKGVGLMPIIRPMADLRDTGKISELCYQKDEPVFITKNGSGHLVVMSIDTYEKQMGLLDVYRKLGAAERQLEDGIPLLEGEEVFGRLRKKHGK